LSELDAYEEIGFEQQKVDSLYASSAQHPSDEEFGSFSAEFEGSSKEDFFHMDLSPSCPSNYMSKSI
jgi:hypothetical protein